MKKIEIFLKNYDEEELNRNYSIEVMESLYIIILSIELRTFYKFDNQGDYILALSELRKKYELGNDLNQSSTESDSDSDSDDKKIISYQQTFKSDECVLCLTNSPNILFCNCGHICICIECSKIKTLLICPICKTENTIKRLIE